LAVHLSVIVCGSRSQSTTFVPERGVCGPVIHLSHSAMSIMRNRKGRKPDADESYDISESSSRDPDAPHASDSWYEEYDFPPEHPATVTKNARTVALLERLCSKKDATIADLLHKEREHTAKQSIPNQSALPKEFEDDCFIAEMEDRVKRLEKNCASKDRMIDKLRSSANDLEIICGEYVEEIKALKAIMVGNSLSSVEKKKDREIFDLNKEIREQALEIHTLRSQMDYWKTTVLADLEKRLAEKDQIITEIEFERKTLITASLAQEVKAPGSPKADFENRQLKATIDDLKERLRQTKEPSQLVLNINELEVELEQKQSEINAMDAELETTMHQLWMAEERNSKLQKKLDRKESSKAFS
jgi:predicted RNase H-like nuclease (RuvC/YqgF family)